jgi:hypothetical protein
MHVWRNCQVLPEQTNDSSCLPKSHVSFDVYVFNCEQYFLDFDPDYLTVTGSARVYCNELWRTELTEMICHAWCCCQTKTLTVALDSGWRCSCLPHIYLLPVLSGLPQQDELHPHILHVLQDLQNTSIKLYWNYKRCNHFSPTMHPLGI